MNKMTLAVLQTLRWTTEHFASMEETLGKTPEEFSPELRAALAQKQLLEEGYIQVTDPE